MGDELSFLVFSRDLYLIFWRAVYCILVERASHRDRNNMEGAVAPMVKNHSSSLYLHSVYALVSVI